MFALGTSLPDGPDRLGTWPNPEQSVRIGVDVGGTFTDVVLLNESDCPLAFHKTPSTPEDPAIAIVQG